MPISWLALACAGIAVPAAALAVAAVVARRRLTVVAVDGESMSPAFHSGDRVLAARRAAGPAVGEVVVFRLPGGGDSTLIKRVVAVAGDPVPPDVLAVVSAAPGARVPDGALVVFGDASQSADSRRWGYLPAGNVLGVVVRSLGRRPTGRGAIPVGAGEPGRRSPSAPGRTATAEAAAAEHSPHQSTPPHSAALPKSRPDAAL